MSFLSRILDARRKADALDAEIRDFPDTELEGLGLTRADLYRLAHMPEEQILRMHAMAEKLGSWDSVVANFAQVEVALRCAECGAQGTCRKALAADAPGTNWDFCPNADTFRDLATA